MKIGVFGAGAIGAYLGGRLLAAGADVVLVGRIAELAEGFVSVDLDGRRHEARAAYSSDPATLAGCDVILVTVKSTDTAAAARALAEVAPRSIVVSFQNGVSNPALLRAALPRVAAGMVPFNVVREGRVLRQTTSGGLGVERSAGDGLIAALRATGMALHVHADLTRLLWSKLLLNLNNSVNALAGVPLQAELAQRGYRRILAAAIDEGLAVLRAARIRPVRVAGVPPRLVPTILRLPDPVFRRVAGAMLRIDPQASSSMQDDLRRGKPTEIDFLNGEVIRLGERHGVPTPVNARIAALIRAGTSDLSAASLASAVHGS